jgi:16S rRNA (guanine527-N7)-methyltransferase
LASKETQEITSGAHALGVTLSEQQGAALAEYLDILEVTNHSFNLTRIPRADYLHLHVLDSLTAIEAIQSSPGMRILDIGTGAGFPGVPLAAALPNAQVTLLDATRKKVQFVAESAAKCGIKNCEGIHQRAEALARDRRYKGRYEVVVSRAVASFDLLFTLMAPFVAPGGRVIALKGAKVHQELEGTNELIKRLGFSEPRIVSVSLPGRDLERYLVVVDRNP